MSEEYMPWPACADKAIVAAAEAGALENGQAVHQLRRNLNLTTAASATMEEYYKMQKGRKEVARLCIEGGDRHSTVVGALVVAALPASAQSTSGSEPLLQAARQVFDSWKNYTVRSMPHADELRRAQQLTPAGCGSGRCERPSSALCRNRHASCGCPHECR